MKVLTPELALKRIKVQLLNHDLEVEVIEDTIKKYKKAIEHFTVTPNIIAKTNKEITAICECGNIVSFKIGDVDNYCRKCGKSLIWHGVDK